MKKTVLILLNFFFLLVSEKTISQINSDLQAPLLTPGGIFDNVYDRFGNKFALSSINTKSTKPIGGTNSVSAVPTQSCSSGYFVLFFAPGSFFDNNTTAQNAICQVFSDISTFIVSPLSSTSSTVKVNIYCDNTPTTAPSGALGSASALFVFPYNPTNPNQGIIDNQIYKAINTGADPFLNIPMGPFLNSSNFYHGYITCNPAINWNFNINSGSSGSTTHDFYTVFLHEALHALGFMSLIDATGNSYFGAANNYFGRYDKFLFDSFSNPLLSSSTPGCPSTHLAFTSSLSAIGSATSACNPISTTCSTAVQYIGSTVSKVYTPNCFVGGGSLSHFEDLCTAPSYTTGCTGSPANWDDLYFVMSQGQGTGSCYIKRFPKEEERKVLCDIGYSVNSTYSCNSSGAIIDGSLSYHTYTAGFCTGSNLWGLNDGLVNASYIYTAVVSATNAISIPTAAIIGNDSPSTTSISCVEVVYNNATFNFIGSNLVVTINTGGSGLVVLKYLPKDINGKFGTPVYIFAYFITAACNPVDPCVMVQNGGFENLASNSPSQCGEVFGPNTPYMNNILLNCWSRYNSSPDYFVRGCITSNTGGGPLLHNLGTNTYSFNPPLDSYSGSPNNNAILGIAAMVNSTFPGYPSEGMMNTLGSPLVNGLTYQASIWAINRGAPPTFTSSFYPSPPTPVVISFAWMTQNIPGSTFTPICDFTINPGGAWAQYTNTFVFSSTANQSILLVYVNISKTASLNPGLGQAIVYCGIDDISINPLPAPTFVIPNASICGNTSFTNLAQYASPIPGVFTGTGVTSVTTGTLTQYNFNSSGTLTPGNYPISFTYTNSSGCVYNLSQYISVFPLSNLTATLTNNICSNNLTSTLSASCSSCGGSPLFVWQPGSILGNSLSVSPTVNSIYTVTAFGGSCTSSQTLYLPTNCCVPLSTPNFNLNSVTTNTFLVGPLSITNSFTIQPGATCVFYGGEFIFSSNAKITVANGAVLYIQGSHFYTCGSNMWQGIVVQDGGRVVTSSYNGNDNLIEDALTAMDVTNYAINTSTTILNISNTTFNKNYIDINLSNYPITSNAYSKAIKLNNTIFTCRDFTFTGTSWPHTGTVTPELRYTASTNTLAPPYLLQSAPIAYLKAPYNTVRSHCAIQLTDAGATTGSVYPLTFNTIDLSPTSAGDFNLFDAHESFISAINSNVKVNNSVFQNTQTFSVSSTATVAAAIQHSNSTASNFELDLSSSSATYGNRFYNCHYAVKAKSSFNFKMEKATIRSTQSLSSGSSTFQGIFIETNQAGDYRIINNEITNVRDGVNLVFFPAPTKAPDLPFYADATQTVYIYATYIRTLAVNQNTFSPEISTTFSTSNNFVKNAISLTSPPLNFAYVWTSCSCNSLTINDNSIYHAYNGIKLSGLNSYTLTCRNSGTPKIIANNTITLAEDPSNDAQRGIEFTNSSSLPVNQGQKIQTVENNILSVAGGTFAQNNQNIALYYGQDNGAVGPYTGSLYPTPHIICNDLSNANKGFVFNNWNQPASWRGNKMEHLTRGMTLENSGRIGQQGDASNPIDNEWKSPSNWTGTTYGIWTSASLATLSPVYVNTLSTIMNPPNLWGAQPSDSYNSGGIHSATGSYHCGSTSNYTLMNSAFPIASQYASDESFYIANSFAYRYLSINDSMKDVDRDLTDFYNNLSGSSIDKFTQIELKINGGHFAEAQILLDGLNTTDFHQVETNYYNFYLLYLKYMKGEDPLTLDDIDALYDISSLCPGTNGSVVFQTRALYQLLTGKIYNGRDGCSESGGRFAAPPENKPENKIQWDVEMFPNPAQNQLNIVSKTKSEFINVTVKDLTGRLIISLQMKIEDFIAILDIDLMNGAYLITITNSLNEIVTKKLLIAK